ncbi:MAG: hypothetical protein K2V38_11880, partial [Gemmataceae bacterium]|nr:hypothetical protein [Gemmataceae bacterium]
LDIIRGFLKDKGLPASGNRKKVRKRLEDGLDAETISGDDIIDLIDRVEGWGNQHIYLYRSPDELIDRWDTEAKARVRLRAVGQEELLNARRPLLLPPNPQLCSVEWSPRRVCFVWVQRRIWYEHLPDEDYQEDDIEYTARRRHQARGLITFHWDLASGHAALLIQRLPKGNNYKDIRGTFAAVLEPLVRLSKFEPVAISGSIMRLERSGEVRRRSMEMVTARGSRAKFTSGGRRVDAFDDPDLKNARTGLGTKLIGRHGNFSWTMPDDSDRELHVKIYAPDQRLAIFGQCTEDEVRHVLSRVRHHCG